MRQDSEVEYAKLLYTKGYLQVQEFVTGVMIYFLNNMILIQKQLKAIFRWTQKKCQKRDIQLGKIHSSINILK